MNTVEVTKGGNPYGDSGSIFDARCPVSEAHERLEENNEVYDGLRSVLINRPELDRMERHWGIEEGDTLVSWLYIDRNGKMHIMEVDLAIVTLEDGAPLNAAPTAVRSKLPETAKK